MARGPDGVDFVERMRDGVTPRCKKVVVHLQGHLSIYAQCSRSGKVKLEDGTWRCMQHVPENEARRDRAADARQEEQWRKRSVELHGQEFLNALWLIADGHKHPQTLARRVIKRFGRETR